MCAVVDATCLGQGPDDLAHGAFMVARPHALDEIARSPSFMASSPSAIDCWVLPRMSSTFG